MKVCKTCKIPKALDLYSSCKPNADGKQNNCKECEKLRMVTYSRTIKGFIVKMYTNQKNRSKRRGHPMPSYTRQELENWLTANEKFIELYNNWVTSNYKRELAPSLDRVNEALGYSFDNVRLVLWSENNQRQYDERYFDLKQTKQSIGVRQYSLDGEFIAEYTSYSAAGRATNMCDTVVGRIARGLMKPKNFIFERAV